MYYLEAGYGKHNRLRNAILLALAFHVALLVGISFESGPGSSYQTPQIEVTLATRPSAATPDEARHIAQADQSGSGEPAETLQRTSPDNTRSADGEDGPQALLLPEESLTDPLLEAVTTAAASRQAVSDEERVRDQQPLLGVSPEVDKLTRELADLEAELDVQSRSYADMPRVKRITSVAAKQSASAAYLLDWRRRVEAVGNKYYPEASVRYGIYGSLRLLVAIRADGGLDDIRVLSSSGFAVLDEAAIKIVRMAAPFSPFPEELRATTDKLEIIRTWQFQENRLSSQ